MSKQKLLPGRTAATVALALALVGAGIGFGFDRAGAAPVDVVIAEFRTRGPGGGSDEFVELRNTGTAKVAIGGWRLRGCAGTAPGRLSTRAVVPAGTLLAPGARYRFVNAAARDDRGSAGAAVQTYRTGLADLGATSFAGLVLEDADGERQDGVGGGPDSPCREGRGLAGAGAGGPEAVPSDGLRRRAGGTRDTGDNAADFEPVVASDGGAGAAAADGGAPAGGGRSDARRDVDGTTNDSTGASTSGGDDPAAATADCVPSHTIMQVQGAGHVATVKGSVIVRGTITARTANGFFLQDPDGDGDPRTSDALFVFTARRPAAAWAVDEPACVRGTVAEFRAGGPDSANLSVTQLVRPSVGLLPARFRRPVAPTLIGAAGRRLPTRTIFATDDGGTRDADEDRNGDGDGDVEAATRFDPVHNGLDFYESLEAMRVRVDDAVAVSATRRNGEVHVLADGGAGATGRNRRGGITVTGDDGAPGRATGQVPERADFNPERIRLAHGLVPAVRMPRVAVGDGLGSVTGVLHYGDGSYALLPAQVPVLRVAGLAPEVTAFARSADVLTVASYNVENLDAADPPARFEALARQIVTNLAAPDVLALQEVQDDDGPTSSGGVRAGATLARLRDAILAAGGPRYAWAQIDPEDGADGGEPGGNIRPAFLYDPARVTLAPGTPGGATEAAQPRLDAQGLGLSRNPGRLEPAQRAFADSRKPLALAVRFAGRRLLLVNLHLAARRSSEPLYGRRQPPAVGAATQRLAQLRAVRRFAETAFALDPQARLVVLGDFNTLPFEAPLRHLRGSAPPVLHDLVDELLHPASERYSYVFDGNAQALDHVLVSPSLRDGARVDVVHVNSEFPERVSDHDPIVAALRVQ